MCCHTCPTCTPCLCCRRCLARPLCTLEMLSFLCPCQPTTCCHICLTRAPDSSCRHWDRIPSTMWTSQLPPARWPCQPTLECRASRRPHAAWSPPAAWPPLREGPVSGARAPSATGATPWSDTLCQGRPTQPLHSLILVCWVSQARRDTLAWRDILSNIPGLAPQPGLLACQLCVCVCVCVE